MVSVADELAARPCGDQVAGGEAAVHVDVAFQIDGATQLFPILGDPIVAVESPARLTRALALQGFNGVCVPMHVAAGDLASVVQGLARVPNVRGLLVTMPHKAAAYRLCASSTERSKRLAVVSVMRRNPDGSWHGDTLDGAAFAQALTDRGARLDGARVLLIVLGALRMDRMQRCCCSR